MPTTRSTAEKLEITFKIAEFLALKNQIAEMTKTLDKQKEELRGYLDAGSDTLSVGDHSITVKRCTRNTIDTKALQAAHPKLAEKFMKTTSYDTVTIK